MIRTDHIRRSASGVPILSHAQIDSLGEQLAGDFEPDLLAHPQELDIESFIEFYMGLKLDFKFLSNCGMFLGMSRAASEAYLLNDAQGGARGFIVNRV